MSHPVAVFYDVHMGASHTALRALLEDGGKNLGTKDVAVFVNKSWTAAKVLYHGGLILYYRSQSGRSFAPEFLAQIPSRVPATRIGFSPAQKAAMQKISDSRVLKKLPRLAKAVGE